MPPAWICRALTTGPPEVPSDSFLINVRTTPEASAMYLGYLAPLWLLLSLICWPRRTIEVPRDRCSVNVE